MDVHGTEIVDFNAPWAALTSSPSAT